MSKIDRYLLQALRADRVAPEVPTAGMIPIEADAAAEAPRIPMLIRISDPVWSTEGIPDLVVHSRLGTVVSARGSINSLVALERDPDVVTIEASRPMEPELSVSLPFVRGSDVQSQVGERGDSAIFGLIDGGLDVLHEAFRDAQGRTRILALWDQTDMSGNPHAHPAGYGTVHLRADIDGYIQNGAIPTGLGRDLVNGHGTHVASIGAGRAVGQFAGGMAPEARIVAVISRVDVDPSDPVSLGYSHNHVDALAWIREVARQEQLPAAVNISLGMNAGAHDGTSLLEAAMDEFSSGGRAPGLVLVKSAGNEGGRNGHAMLNVQTGTSGQLRWRSGNITRRQDVIELWYHSSAELEIELEDPAGNLSPRLSLAQPERSGSFPSGDSFELDLERLHRDNGDSRILVRIHRGGASAVFAQGLWTLHIHCIREFGRRTVHAWIERIDSRPISFATHQVNDFSLSIPGTARTAIAVGSIQPQVPFQLATSSSRGLTRDGREKPDLVAPGDTITAARAGTASGTIAKGGTSMAAPHVTGALVLLLSHWSKRQTEVPGWRQLNAAQLRAAVTNTCQSFNGGHDPGLGFGALDTRALFDFFT